MKAHPNLYAGTAVVHAIGVIAVALVLLLLRPIESGPGAVRDTSGLVHMTNGSPANGRGGRLLFTVVRGTVQGPDLAAAKISMAVAQRNAILAASRCAMAPTTTVRIDANGVVGGSAGLMLAVTIVRDLLRLDITGGRVVAGTGAIAADGTVGPVGHVREKAIAAERGGADIFLVPSSQRAEAIKAVRTIDVVGVRSLTEAMRHLTNTGCRSETSRKEHL
jgi:predicted S18 family serine protease